MSKSLNDKTEKGFEESQTRNEDEKDDNALCQHDVKVVSMQNTPADQESDHQDLLVEEVQYSLKKRAQERPAMHSYQELEKATLREVMARDRALKWTTAQIRAAIVEITTADEELTARCIDPHSEERETI